MIYLFSLLTSLSLFAQTPAPVSNCGPGSPTINLEEAVPYPGATTPGTLHNLPQDNQNGIGTCYANVSRNLLYGVSGGRDNASYLDLALAYKRAHPNEPLTEAGLDAGNICPTLAAAQAQGYCPQELAPLETGARTEIARLMGVESDPFTAQARINEALRNFFARSEGFVQSPVAASMLPRLAESIETLRSNPRIKFPFPGMNVPFINPGAFKNATVPPVPGAKQPPTPEAYYAEQLSRVSPRIFTAIVQGKTAEEIHAIYTSGMASTLRAMGLTATSTEYRPDYIRQMTAALSAPNFREEVAATLGFLRQISGRTGDSEEAFLSYCSQNLYPSIELLNTLGPVLTSLSAVGGNPSSLITPAGNIIPAVDAFQMAVAPSCMARENRRRPSVNFSCDDRSFDALKNSRVAVTQKLSTLRSRISQSLYRGIPVGRSFPQGRNGGHVNTVVGFRYDPASRTCQYLIRDSQGGTSTWQGERAIFDDSDEMNFLTVIP